jgi:hypothetical protein
MITVKMTEAEYKAYLLYRKSVDLIKNSDKKSPEKVSVDDYLSIPENQEDFKAGLDDLKKGRISFIDPEKLWENIK